MATVETAPRLASAEELREAWTKLADVEVEFLDPILHSVFEALNFEGEQSITFDQIGRLGAWADSIEATASGIARLAANVKETAFSDLPAIATSIDGNNPHAPRFDRWGTRI